MTGIVACYTLARIRLARGTTFKVQPSYCINDQRLATSCG